MSTRKIILFMLILSLGILTVDNAYAASVTFEDDYSTSDNWVMGQYGTITGGTMYFNGVQGYVPTSITYDGSGNLVCSFDFYMVYPEYGPQIVLGTGADKQLCFGYGAKDTETADYYIGTYNNGYTYTSVHDATLTNAEWHNMTFILNTTGLYLYCDGDYKLGQPYTNYDTSTAVIKATYGNNVHGYIDNFYYNNSGIPKQPVVNGELNAQIVIVNDPVTLFTNASATLILNNTTLYNDIQWFYDVNKISEYKLTGSQWQQWNGTAWVNCANSTVFTQSHYVSSAEDHAFSARISRNETMLGAAYKSFHVTNNGTQVIYYMRVVDNTGADLYNFTGSFTESEDASKTYTFNYSGYGATLDLNRHYQGSIDADGYLSGVIAFETVYNSSASTTQRTITITMLGSDQPTDPAQAFLDVKIYDAATGEMIPDAIFTLTNISGSKTYNIYGTVKRITIQKNLLYTWKAASSSYNSMTGTVNMSASQAMLSIPLNPVPVPTAAPTTPGSSGGNIGGTTVTLTPSQRENQAMTMIDQLLEAGPSLMQIAILAVFMGLVMMLFPGGNGGRKRYYR